MWIREHKIWISSWWVWIICVFLGALGSIPQQMCAGTQIDLDHGGVRDIGEYSAKKIYFFPGHQKNCSKVSPYFSLFEEENCRNLHFFGKKIVKISFFG